MASRHMPSDAAGTSCLDEGYAKAEAWVAALRLSVYTVEAHRGRIMEKLNLHSTGELVRFAVRHGVID